MGTIHEVELEQEIRILEDELGEAKDLIRELIKGTDPLVKVTAQMWLQGSEDE